MGAGFWLAASAASAAELVPAELRELEELLARVGFDPGPVDGIADAQTGTAIRGYQTFAALPVDGQASTALLTELRGLVETLASLKTTAREERAVAASTPPAEAETLDPAPTQAAAIPSTAVPLAAVPLAAVPLAAVPSTAVPSTAVPSTAVPSTAVPLADDRLPPPPTPRPWRAPPTAEQDADGDVERPVPDFVVQLAVTETVAGARREWSRMLRELPGLLTGEEPRGAAIEQGDRGRLYSLRSGAFRDRAAAAAFCAKAGGVGQDCVVIATDSAPPGEELAPTGAPQATARTGAGSAEFAQGTQAFQTGDCKAATDHYTRALALGGLPRAEHALAFNNRGRCLFEGGLYDAAIANLSAAITLRPDYAAAFFNRGRTYEGAGDHPQALADLKRAYELGFRSLGSTGAPAP